jgi:class 3 adenylate cyclase
MTLGSGNAISTPCIGGRPRIVRANNGRVSKTIGDCVMAYFLGPRHHADAVLCAGELLDSFQRLYEYFYGIDSTLWQFKVTAGVCSGQVYFLYPRDPYGPPVDLAARLQSVAEPGCAAIAAWTYERAFQVDSSLRVSEEVAREDTVSLKGFGEVKIVRIR